MPQLVMSDDIFYTCRNQVSGLFNFLKDDLDFNVMSVKFLDNNPLSFVLVIKIDELPEVKSEFITSAFFKNKYAYYQNIALAIKSRMIEQEDLARYAKNEIKYGLSFPSPPSTNNPEDSEIEF